MNFSPNPFINRILILQGTKNENQEQKQSNDTDHHCNRWGLDSEHYRQQ